MLPKRANPVSNMGNAVCVSRLTRPRNWLATPRIETKKRKARREEHKNYVVC